jgi:hypothetical protein
MFADRGAGHGEAAIAAERTAKARLTRSRHVVELQVLDAEHVVDAVAPGGVSYTSRNRSR